MIILLFLTVGVATIPSAQAQTANYVVINEFELNPLGDDYVAGAQFVELYNPTSTSVNIGGWRISTTHFRAITVRIPSGTPIPPKGFYVVTNTTKWLDNEFESIILTDATSNEVDRTPVKSDTFDDARTWQRNPDGKDTNTDDDWIFQTGTRNSPIPEFPSAPVILATTFLVIFILLKTQKLVPKSSGKSTKNLQQ